MTPSKSLGSAALRYNDDLDHCLWDYYYKQAYKIVIKFKEGSAKILVGKISDYIDEAKKLPIDLEITYAPLSESKILDVFIKNYQTHK